MSSQVPRITGEEAIKAFSKDGYIDDHTCGSHHILKHPNRRERLSIPVHGRKTIGIGLLRSQIRIAGMTPEQFSALL